MTEMKTKNKTVTAAEILYFNDKYIFVEMIDTTKKSDVQVFKFEAFTDE